MSYTRLKMVQFGPGGDRLVGTVGYALYNSDGSLNAARTTAGISERPAGSGTYAATVTFPDSFTGELRWDTGGATPKYASEPVNPAESETGGMVTFTNGLVNATYTITVVTAGPAPGGVLVSNLTPYLSPADFLKFADVRIIGDLCSDTGTRVTASALLTDPNLNAALQAASGRLEAACLKSSRYTPADLLVLSTSNSGYLLREIIAGITKGILYRRRPERKLPPPPEYEEATKYLDELGGGAAIFGLQGVMDAGVISHEVERPDEVEARNMTTRQAEHYFGRRSNRW